MIRQYIALAMVLLIAVFIFTELEWRGSPKVVDLVISTGEKKAPSDADISFRDLRVGGVSGAPRQRKAETMFSAPAAPEQSTAASSSPFSATSTPFQTSSSSPDSYAGVNIEFSNHRKAIE